MTTWGILIGASGMLAIDRAIDGRLFFALTYAVSCAAAIVLAISGV